MDTTKRIANRGYVLEIVSTVRAANSSHESSACEDLHFDENHKCINCKDKKGFKTHNAGEKYSCEYFLDYYMARCTKLNLLIENLLTSCILIRNYSAKTLQIIQQCVTAYWTGVL